MRLIELITCPNGKLSSGRLIGLCSFISAIIFIILDIIIKDINISQYVLTLLGIAGGLKVMDRIPKSEDAKDSITFDKGVKKKSNK